MNRIAIALVPVLLSTTMPALAHSPIMGIGGVTGGILHALLIPEHGLGLLALGLVLGLLERPARRTGFAVFAAALLCGLVAAGFAVGEALAADILLAATGILGLLVVTLWTPAALAWGAAAVVGLTIALDSRPEVASNVEAIPGHEYEIHRHESGRDPAPQIEIHPDQGSRVLMTCFQFPLQPVI